MQATISTSMGGREWLMLVTLSVLWGGSFFFVGIVVEQIPPLALVLWGIVLATGRRIPRDPAIWLVFMGMGILNNVIPFSLIVWGQAQIASRVASILNATTPLFTVIVATWLLPDERATPLKMAGVVAGFAGTVVMFGSSFMGEAGTLLAQVAILGAALSYAFAGAFGRRFRELGVDPVVTAAGQVTASSLVLGPVVLLHGGFAGFQGLAIESWASIIALGVLSTALAYVLYFRILESAGATNLLLVTLLVPVSAILLGWLFLGERLLFVHYFGMALIAIGLSAIDGRMWQRASKKPGS